MIEYFKMSGSPRTVLKKANLIVLAFVLAHAIFCALLHNTAFGDSIVLTILTLAMVFSLIKFYGVSFDIFLGLAFLASFAGFYLGTQGAVFLHAKAPSLGIWINIIMTTIITELLGQVIILLLLRGFSKK